MAVTRGGVKDAEEKPKGKIQLVSSSRGKKPPKQSERQSSLPPEKDHDGDAAGSGENADDSDKDAEYGKKNANNNDGNANDGDGNVNEPNRDGTPPKSPDSATEPSDDGHSDVRSDGGDENKDTPHSLELDANPTDSNGGNNKLTEECPPTRDPDCAYGKYGNEILAIMERIKGGFTILALDYIGIPILAPGTNFPLKVGERDAKTMVDEHLAKKNCVSVAKTREKIAGGYKVDPDKFEVQHVATYRHGPEWNESIGTTPECLWVGQEDGKEVFLGGNIDDLVNILGTERGKAEEYLIKCFRKEHKIPDGTDVLQEVRRYLPNQPTIHERLTGKFKAEKAKKELERIRRTNPELVNDTPIVSALQVENGQLRDKIEELNSMLRSALRLEASTATRKC